MKKAAILLVFLLTACSSGEEVYLRKQGASSVTCGPYGGVGVHSMRLAREKLRDCVEDYQRQGYQRAPTP